MTKTLKCDVLVVGTGIIGSMAALYLQNDGRDVVLLERGDISRGASSGNAGILAFPEIIPIPAPGIMKKAPRWLFDPLGPLSVPPAYAPKIAPWLWRFWRASAERSFRHGLKSLTEINRLAATEMAHIAAMPELSPFISKTGTLDIYDSEASLNAARRDWDEKEKAGFAFQRVDRNEIEELQPGLAPQFRHAVFSADGLQVSDPYDFTRAIFDLVISRGAILRKGEAQRIDAVGESTIVTLENGDKIDADKVVIACGAWSKTCGDAWQHRPAGNGTRIQHDPACRCFQPDTPALFQRPRLRCDPLVDWHPRRRRRRTRRAGTEAELPPRGSHVEKKRNVSFPASNWKADGNGWGSAPPCRTVFPSLAPRGRHPPLSTPSATVIWG